MTSRFYHRRNKQPHNHGDVEKKESPFFSKEAHTPFFSSTLHASVQPRLRVGQAGDSYEQEADKVADAVANQPVSTPGIQQRAISGIQMESLATPVEDEKKGTAEQRMEEDKLVQEKQDTPQQLPEEEEVQKKAVKEEEEEAVQKKAEGSNHEATSVFSQKLKRESGGGNKLPKDTRMAMESSFGRDFQNVHIHTDEESVAMNEGIGARAFTHGNDIYFNRGMYDPVSQSGKHLLAHELTHTVQQSHIGQKEILNKAEKGKDACASYENNEVRTSYTQKGLMENDAFIATPMSLVSRQGDLIISDFGVDWGSVKASAQKEPLFQDWLRAFEDNPDYILEIRGYSDCTGVEKHNESLRKRRAAKVFQVLNKARPRVALITAAPAGEYLTGNGDPGSRAINRGVAISFSRTINYPGDVIEVPKPKPPVPKPKIPDPKADTEDCDDNQSKALTRGLALAKQMVRAALGEMENEALMKKYFGKDAMAHRFHIQANFVAILNGLKSSPTFECNSSGSWICDGAVARVIPIVGLNIHICPEAINRGDEYLAMTIVHEAGHGYAFIFMPDDLCSGGWPATESTEDAEDNADCYGEFAGEANKL